MRNTREGFLTREWKDFKFQSYLAEVLMTKDGFERNWGEFLQAVYPDKESETPYALWTEKYVVIILGNVDKLGLASITRNPSTFSFG